MRLAVLKMLQKGTVALPGTRVLLPPLSDDGCRLRAPARPGHAANARRQFCYTKSDENSSRRRWLLTTSQAVYGFISSQSTKNKDKTKTKARGLIYPRLTVYRRWYSPFPFCYTRTTCRLDVQSHARSRTPSRHVCGRRRRLSSIPCPHLHPPRMHGNRQRAAHIVSALLDQLARLESTLFGLFRS